MPNKSLGPGRRKIFDLAIIPTSKEEETWALTKWGSERRSSFLFLLLGERHKIVCVCVCVCARILCQSEQAADF